MTYCVSDAIRYFLMPAQAYLWRQVQNEWFIGVRTHIYGKIARIKSRIPLRNQRISERDWMAGIGFFGGILTIVTCNAHAMLSHHAPFAFADRDHGKSSVWLYRGRCRLSKIVFYRNASKP